jgi:hypothetical protein
MKINGKIIQGGTAVLVMMLFAGCAQVMCMNQPDPFTPTTLHVGNNRLVVLSEFGQPVGTDQRENKLTETYTYADGGAANMWGWKTFRILAYTAGDLFTLWIDQLVWMPLESFAFDGDKYSATVEYETQNDGPWLVKNTSVLRVNNSPSKKY